MTHLQGRICWDILHEIYIAKTHKIHHINLPVGECGLIHNTLTNNIWSNNAKHKLKKYTYSPSLICYDNNCKTTNKKPFYVKKMQGNKILFLIPSQDQKLSYLKNQIIWQINEFAKTIEHKYMDQKNSQCDKLNLDKIKHKFNFDISQYENVSFFIDIINSINKGYYLNSNKQGIVTTVIKWLLLYNDFDAIAKLSTHLQLDRIETVSHSQFYPFGITMMRFQIMNMYININILILVILSGKKVSLSYFGEDFWKKIFTTGSMYSCETQDYFSHLIEEFNPPCNPINFDLTSIIVNEKIKQFCDLSKLQTNAKKLFNTMVLMQYLENNGPFHEYKLKNEWSEVIDHIFNSDILK